MTENLNFLMNITYNSKSEYFEHIGGLALSTQIKRMKFIKV